MKKSRFTDSQIIAILKEAESGVRVPDLFQSADFASGRDTGGLDDRLHPRAHHLRGRADHLALLAWPAPPVGTPDRRRRGLCDGCLHGSPRPFAGSDFGLVRAALGGLAGPVAAAANNRTATNRVRWFLSCWKRLMVRRASSTCACGNHRLESWRGRGCNQQTKYLEHLL